MITRTLQISGGLILGAVVGAALASFKRRRAFSFHGRTVIITGGSRGLGLVMAREFARQGAQLALLARDPEELRRAEFQLREHGAQVIGVPCDLRHQEEVDDAVRRIVGEFGRIDVLVNNAGIIQVGPFDRMTLEDFEEAISLHVRAPLFTTLAVLPHLRRVGGGRIVNIASVNGKIAFPHLLPYTVSKFALVGLSDGLRAELRREKIYVTTVCPGLMRTGSPPNALVKGNHRREYAWFAIADSLPLISLDADRAARKIVAACRRGAARLIVGVPAKATVLLSELFPECVSGALALANRLLPGAPSDSNAKARLGWESGSVWSRSFLTRLMNQAAAQNNQRPPAGAAQP